jgi:hypothetical protein
MKATEEKFVYNYCNVVSITHTEQLQKYNLITTLKRMNNMKKIKEIGLQ